MIEHPPILIYASNNSSVEAIAKALLTACKNLSIPTILVSKEDTCLKEMASLFYLNPIHCFKNLLKIAQKHSPFLSLAASDTLQPLVAHLNEALNCKGLHPSDISLLDKWTLHSHLLKENLNAWPTEMILGDSCFNRLRANTDFSSYIYVKPCLGSGNWRQYPFDYQAFSSIDSFYSFLKRKNLLETFYKLNSEKSQSFENPMGRRVVQKLFPLESDLIGLTGCIYNKKTFFYPYRKIYHYPPPHNDKYYLSISSTSNCAHKDIINQEVISFLESTQLSSSFLNFQGIVHDGRFYLTDPNLTLSDTFAAATPHFPQSLISFLYGGSFSVNSEFLNCSKKKLVRHTLPFASGVVKKVSRIEKKLDNQLQILDLKLLKPGYKISPYPTHNDSPSAVFFVNHEDDISQVLRSAVETFEIEYINEP